MNSVLGIIELGSWELGFDIPVDTLTGRADASAFPGAKVTGLGGIIDGFNAIPGTMQLGNFELGQIIPNVTSQTIIGKGFSHPRGFPDIGLPQPTLTAQSNPSGFPELFVLGNRGRLLVTARGFPDVSVTGVEVYSVGNAVAQGNPDVIVTALIVGHVIALGIPDLILAPISTQQVDCAVGSNPPDLPSGPANEVY